MAVDVPEGRQQLEGEVLSVKMKYTAFGDTLKMLVRVTTDEGIFKVWGTVPTNLVADIERNHVVRFTATLKRSDDRGFGFFSRPAKASIVEPSSVEV
ncbi:MAG: hypothetical protein AMS18_07125 [Gemmatimonas sp. SG8_17]|nr:MAG: hypothetical protein AMS18_07125 [Gemmatimonas sp. SG8_17]